MAPPHPATEAWAELWRRRNARKTSLSRLTGSTVGSSALRTEAKEAVQHYFREVRPHLVALRFDGPQVEALDQVTQHILELAARPNRKSTYKRRIRDLDGRRGAVEAAIEIRASGGLPPPAARLT